MTFTVPGSPPSNNRTTRHVNGRVLKSREAREYQARVASLAMEACGGIEPSDEPVAVMIVAAGIRLDIDNIAKSILDGMNGVAYVDDRNVVDLRVVKKRAKKCQACVRVTVEAA